jgi:putative membrane-bound dehydrogenase-like protein
MLTFTVLAASLMYPIQARTDPAAGQEQGGARAESKSPRDVTAEFALAPDLQVTLWAEAPQLFNPTAMDTDALGRIWVTEAVNYRKWRGRNPGLEHPEGDRVVILEDTDGDGDADTSRVFAQDKDLVSPLGICVLAENQALVSCSPSAFIYTDTDGDGKADQREVFLTGFGGHDHDHGLHSFVIGPDGRYYFAVGNAGPHIVTDKAGWTLRSGSLYNDGGEVLADNKPGLVSDDGRVWVGGLILRCNRDGTGLTVMAHNFRNEYEVALDSFGNMWTSDNDDDGSQGCRALWVMEGGNHGYFSADGSRFWSADKRPGQSTTTAHWHQDDPGVVPCGTITGSGGPTGVAIYEGDLFGWEFRGRMLAADSGRNCVFGMIPHREGGGYLLEQTTFLTSILPGKDDEKARWFRPSDVLVGTDGAVYVSDWWDPGVGGHAMGDKQAYGRILRIAPNGKPARTPKIDLQSIAGLVTAVKNPAQQVRSRALDALGSRMSEAAPLVKLVGDPNPRNRARALWGFSRVGKDVAGFDLGHARESSPEVELTLFRAFGRRAPNWDWLKGKLGGDPHWPMRTEAALALRGESMETKAVLWPALAHAADLDDRWYLAALSQVARGSENELFVLMGLDKSDPLDWSALDAKLAWVLHPACAVSHFAVRAGSMQLTPQTRREALDALAFIKTREAAEAVLDLALAGPEDIKPLAKWWIENRDTNDWREYHLAAQIDSPTREGAVQRFASGIVKSGSVDIDVDVTGARTLWLVVTEGRSGNGCDWSDWIAPRLVGPEGEVPLTKLAWRSATAGWGHVNVGLNCNGGPLRIGEKTFADGIGTHAASEIVYELPEKRFTRFKATAGLDFMGTSQACGNEVGFQVLVNQPADRTRWAALRSALLREGAPAPEREAAAKELSAEREGGLLLLEWAENGELDDAAKGAVAKTIFTNPDLSVRALASQYFQRPAAGGAPLPSVAELAKLPGDPRNGQRVFFSATANCATCHTIRGRGGDIGPDLTQVRAKYGANEIFDAILNPSAAIAFGFDTWMLATEDERLYSGFVLADGDTVVIKDTGGKRTALEKGEIVSRRKSKLSSMPDNVALGLKPQELADVVAFLREEWPRPPSRPGEEIALFNGKDLAGWTFHLNDAAARMEDVWSVSDGVLHCQGNPIGYLRTQAEYTSFVLTLEWRFPPGSPPGNSGVLMRKVGPDKVWPKSIEAQLQHRNAGDIWNIDEFPMQTEPSRTDGRHTGKALPCNEKPLGEWNRYVITLDRGELTLEVNGEVQNRASWCDEVAGSICLQSEGAPIEFRNVRLRPLD